MVPDGPPRESKKYDYNEAPPLQKVVEKPPAYSRPKGEIPKFAEAKDKGIDMIKEVLS